MNKQFKVAPSIMKQIPFFACSNIILSPENQKDISRYVYSSEFNCPAYKGSYGEQPYKWVTKSFLIKSALQERENTSKENSFKEK